MRTLCSVLTISGVMTLTACANFSPYGGVSYHDTSLDSPEIRLDSTLGIVGTEYKRDNWGDVKLFCEHISAIAQTERGGGLNHCGFKLQK